MNLFVKTISIILLTLIATNVPAQKNDSIAVKSAVDKFVQSFNSLNWEPFRNSFTEDATIFFPEWQPASRQTGKAEIEKTWLEIFPEFTDPNDSLQLNIDPKNILIQLYDNTAIVTFHLGTGEKYLARRTLVMIKKKGEWKIAHLHASYMLAPEKK